MTRTLRTVAVVTATAGTLLLVAACGSGHGTGSVTPLGTTHGTYRYCSYTPTGSGISISQYEYVPCVVQDTRTKKARKAQPTQRATISSTVVVIPHTGRTATVKAPSAPKTTKTVKSSKSSSSKSLRKH